jgi:hypothetical protein
MIEKINILIDNKLILNRFIINHENNKIIINNMDMNNIIKVPIYNKYNGLDYYPLIFPLELPIYNNMIFNPYIIFSSLNLESEFDFFTRINEIILKKNLKVMNLEDLDDNIIKIIVENYKNILSTNFLNVSSLELVNNLWLYINLIKLLYIYITIKHANKSLKELVKILNVDKKLINNINAMKNIKYSITDSESDNNMTLIEYLDYNFETSLKFEELNKNSNYYLDVNKPEINKIIKVKVLDKYENKNILINLDKKILYDNYKWYLYHPNIKVNKEYIIYKTFINNIITEQILEDNLKLNKVDICKIINYYYNSHKLCDFVLINKKELEEINIIKSLSYTNEYFEDITKKYENNESKICTILEILFNNYNYPLKNNKHELDIIFDHILYISLYNYKCLFVIKNDILILNQNVNAIVPLKLKNLYMNIIKTFNQIINNDFESITYNQKFYYDYLHKNIIKILLSDTTNISIKLLKKLISPQILEKLKNIININNLLIDVSNKLSWTTLAKKISYLNLFYKNSNIVYYDNKLNKNIISDNFDYRIKKIIENPFEMYKYLRKEKDFIKWTKFISDKISSIYYTTIIIENNDLDLIGKLLFLLFNINEQNTKDETYISFINFCSVHHNLILDSSRINLKIREYFPTLKCTLNLGFLAKHLTWDNDAITFEESTEKTSDIIALEEKLNSTTKKYYKYKAKYLESKESSIDTKYNSETSSVLSSKKIEKKNI